MADTLELPLHHPPTRWAASIRIAIAAAVTTSSCAASQALPSGPSPAGIVAFVHLLESVHYPLGRDEPADFARVITDYMTVLDGSRQIFLESDHKEALENYGDKVRGMLHSGSIEPATKIFEIFARKCADRVTWISKETCGTFSFSTEESIDDTSAAIDWPATAQAADERWRARIKSEILDELLNGLTMAEAAESVRKRYERMLSEVQATDRGLLVEAFLTAVAHIYDGRSTYFSPYSEHFALVGQKNGFVGIGAALDMLNGAPRISEVVPGGPAWRSGRLAAGDRILSIAVGDGDAAAVGGMNLYSLVDLLRGTAGTKVRLVVRPAGAVDSSLREVIELRRGVIEPEEIRARGALFHLPTGNAKETVFGVVRLHAFYGPIEMWNGQKRQTSSASNDVARLITLLQDEHICGLVLDLRQNGGGLLDEAIGCASSFLGRKPVVQIVDQFGKPSVRTGSNKKPAFAGPMVVLVDSASAAASEILAGALQVHGRAVIIGAPHTAGHASIQAVYKVNALMAAPADDEGMAKITIMQHFLPDGTCVEPGGLRPDIVLPDECTFAARADQRIPASAAPNRVAACPGEYARMSVTLLDRLRNRSALRQQTLEEFCRLRETHAWETAARQQARSLNLPRRRELRAEIEARQRTGSSQIETIRAQGFEFQEIRLDVSDSGPAQGKQAPISAAQPVVTNPARATEVALKEALRVLADLVAENNTP
jgi:carboxyl-terminal processing protease